MSKVQNLDRYWIDKYSCIIVRKWTDDEYKNTDPHTHIFEKYWSYYCPICNFIPIPRFDKEKVKRDANTHMLHTGNNHKCVVEYRYHELICLEFKDEFLEDIGIWVHKQKTY